MIRAVLFDLDDTLYAYAPCNEAALAAVHARLAAERELSPSDFRRLHDTVRAELARELAGQAAAHERVLFFKRIVQRLTGQLQPALVGELHETYWTTFERHMRPAPDAHAVLVTLAATRRLAIVSNHTTAPQLRKLERLGLAPYFAALITSQEAGAEKPDPRIFRAALTALGVAPGEAVMVGDDPRTDIRGARAAGLRTVFCARFAAVPAAEVEADACIETLEQLPAVL